VDRRWSWLKPISALAPCALTKTALDLVAHRVEQRNVVAAT